MRATKTQPSLASAEAAQQTHKHTHSAHGGAWSLPPHRPPPITNYGQWMRAMAVDIVDIMAVPTVPASAMSGTSELSLESGRSPAGDRAPQRGFFEGSSMLGRQGAAGSGSPR